MIRRHFLFAVTILFLLFSNTTHGFIDAINKPSNSTWIYKSSENPKMKHNAFVSNIDQKATFSLSFADKKCQSNDLSIYLFYTTSSQKNVINIIKEGFHMTAFRQFFNLKTVDVRREGNHIKATLKPIYSETIHLLDSLEKGNKMSLIWKGDNDSLKPLEFNLKNSGNSIQNLYTNCMNHIYESKR